MIKNDQTLQEIVRRLHTEFRPEKIYLFGSQARNTQRLESDFDLFILIKDSKLSKLDRMDKAQFALRGIPVAVDVVVFTQSEFEELKDIPGTLPETIVREGVELAS